MSYPTFLVLRRLLFLSLLLVCIFATPAMPQWEFGEPRRHEAYELHPSSGGWEHPPPDELAWGADSWTYGSYGSGNGSVPFSEAYIGNGYWGITYVSPNPALACQYFEGSVEYSIDIWYSAYVYIDLAQSNYDIFVNSYNADDFYYALGAHEMGHAAGLGHDYGGVMAQGFNGWQTGGSLFDLYNIEYTCP